MLSRLALSPLLPFLALVASAAAPSAPQELVPVHHEATGAVRTATLVSNASPGLPDDLDAFDLLGSAVACVGDVDGNGVPDYAVGAQGDGDGGTLRGAVYLFLRAPDGSVASRRKLSAYTPGLGTPALGAWSLAPLGDQDGDGVPDLAIGGAQEVTIVFLAGDGSVKAAQEIGQGKGGFAGTVVPGNVFGNALAALGDLDGDGVGDLAVGGERDDDGGFNHGAAWVLFLRADGTVRAQQKISDLAGGFQGTLADGDGFGGGLARLDDLDGDGVCELAVGASGGGSADRGAVWILFLNADGTVKDEQELSEGVGGFAGPLVDRAEFGLAAVSPGDLDGDGLAELAVGAPARNHLGLAEGSVWILFLNADGTVRAEQELGQGKGGFSGQLTDGDSFGDSLGAPGDLDGDGVEDLLVGSPLFGPQGDERGGFWALRLSAVGTVLAEEVLDRNLPVFVETLEDDGYFGSALAPLGDLDGDGLVEVAVGAPGLPGGGAVWILSLRPDGSVAGRRELGSGLGGFPDVLDDLDRFGSSLAAVGDLDGNGVCDLAVGADSDDDGDTDAGAVWILFLEADGSVLADAKISATSGGFAGTLQTADRFGAALCSLGDLNEDGIGELAVGAPGTQGFGSGPGGNTVWILILAADGSVAAERRIGADAGGFQGSLEKNDGFGASLASPGDLDGDGLPELAVGTPYDGEGMLPNTLQGALWILFLTPRASVKAETKISEVEGGFQGTLDTFDAFARGLAATGDLDGDGVGDLAVGASGDDDGGIDRGAVWLLFLTPQGAVAGERKISSTSGRFQGPLENQDDFGLALASPGDLDGDGLPELAVGSPYDDDGGDSHGCLWILRMEGVGRTAVRASRF